VLDLVAEFLHILDGAETNKLKPNMTKTKTKQLFIVKSLFDFV